MDSAMTEGILLVPSAVLVPNELRLDIGATPTALIPLRGRPAIEWISDAYDTCDLTRVVAVGESGDVIEQHVRESDQDWTVVDVSGTRTLGDTVLRALDALPDSRLRGTDLYVNFADTLVNPVPPVDDQSYVAYKRADRPYRWTTFRVEDGSISRLVPKYCSEHDGPQPTFVGLFGLENAAHFRSALDSAVQAGDSGGDDFYTGLLSYLSSRTYRLYEPDTWFDLGHLDTYHWAKRQFLNEREFNDLQIDDRNVVTKRSTDVETLRNEIRWYEQIPDELQPYLPRVYDWSTDEANPYLKLEYVGYPSLSDLQLYGSHGNHIWNGVFHRLLDVLKEFRTFRIDETGGKIRDALEQMYLHKTHRRLDALRESDRLTELFETEEVRVNGDRLPSVNRVLDQLRETIATEGLLDVRQFSVIHGDLCLPNVLYDPRNEILKLIDPRGKFGEFAIHGDPRYDVAKLRHSMVGHYEHIINDNFVARYNPSVPAIDYEIRTTDAQERRESRFDDLLASRSDTDLRAVRLVEALLFLSMVPLHSDSISRQQCMIAQGLEKITPFLD